jgi:uncharacterized damage-inducible protein DinB
MFSMSSMSSADLTTLRYPIGKRATRGLLSTEERAAAISEIMRLPADLRRAAAGLADAQLDTPYRPDGWTVRQLVHHLADAHAVMTTRIRTALTEDNPPVKMWDEVPWAELPDAKAMPIDVSLSMVDALHARMTYLLRALTPDQFTRTSRHPEWGTITVDYLVDLCAWHGKHHTAQISGLRERNSW